MIRADLSTLLSKSSRPTRTSTKTQWIRPFWNFLKTGRRHPENLLVGSAGSGKSWSIAKHVIETCYPEALGLGGESNIRWACFRKTRPALKKSCLTTIRERLEEYGWPYEINLTDLIIRNPHANNEIHFMGLDEAHKVRSFEFNYGWIEEMTEISKYDYTMVKLSARRYNANGINEIYGSLNPISAFHWIKTDLIDHPTDHLAVMHSTWQDNPFLSGSYIQSLLDLAAQNPAAFKIYGLGEWGTLANLIFANWDIKRPGLWPESFPHVFYGLDFGYLNPTALLEIGLNDRHAWLRGRLYQTGWTNDQLIAWMHENVDKDVPIWADSEDPSRIQEISEAGFLIYPADKKAGSVIRDINFCQRFRFHLHPEDIDVKKEIAGWVRQMNKDGVVLDKPITVFDHYMSCLRYGMWGFHHQGLDGVY